MIQEVGIRVNFIQIKRIERKKNQMKVRQLDKEKMFSFRGKRVHITLCTKVKL